MVSIKIDKLNTLIEKAKAKKDGVFSSSPYKYAVKDGGVRFIGEKYSGNVAQFCYGFLSPIGKVETWELDKELKRLLSEA